MTAPLPYVYQGEGEFRALPRFASRCDKEFVIGQSYLLEAREERSQVSHNHFFASVAEAWKNLPEHYGERFATPDHLRKYCLIKRGWHDQRSVVCASKAEAQRLAAFIKPIDEFAVVVASEAVVTVYTAKSQSMKAMGKKDFQRSKDDVLSEVAAMIGVAPDELERARAA